MLRTCFLQFYCIQEPTHIVRLCPLNSRLDPHGRVSRKVGASLKLTHSWTIGWVCTTLHHHSPHRRHNRTTTSPWFLDVTFGHRTGMGGRRLTHHLRVVADVVETCLSTHETYYYLCMRHIYARMYDTYYYVCTRHIIIYVRNIPHCIN